MCGIYGVASGEGTKNARSRAETFCNGMLFNMPRGWDSTGVATVKQVNGTESDVSFYKRALHVVDYFESKAAKKLLSKFEDYYYVLGHCRAATRGNSTDLNAHPFQYGHITLVHNGTVAQHLLPKRADESVDSADIAASMADAGELETLEKLEGAFSLVWYNQNDDSLNFARNKRKPLAFAFVKDENTMYYGSEWATLYATMLRNNEQPDGKILVPKPFIWYKFNKEDLRKYTVTEFKEYAHPPYGRPRNSHGWSGPTSQLPPITVHQPLLLENTTTSKENDEKPITNESTTGNTPIKPPEEPQGVPSTASRIRLVAAQLSKFGLSIGRLIICNPTKWVPYKNQRQMLGYLEGRRGEGDIPVVIYGITATAWSSYCKRGKIACRCVNIRMNYQGVEGQVAIVGVIDEKWDANFEAREVKSLPSQSTTTVLPERPAEREKAVQPTPIYLLGPGGSHISPERWLRLVAEGCGGCVEPLNMENASQILWIGDSPVCHECASHGQVREALGLHTISPAMMN